MNELEFEANKNRDLKQKVAEFVESMQLHRELNGETEETDEAIDESISDFMDQRGALDIARAIDDDLEIEDMIRDEVYNWLTDTIG